MTHLQHREIPTQHTATDASQRRRKAYIAPCICSVEPLEAIAAACNGTGGYGKSIPIPCGTAGS